MIKGMHAMFYSSDAAATRSFLRDKLGFAWADVGDGWLIFEAPEADIGCHPTEEGGTPPGTHNVSFYCDDIHATMAVLRGRGVEFDAEPMDAGFGLVTHFTMPGGVSVQLYQPRYERIYQ